jgi:threonine synthase
MKIRLKSHFNSIYPTLKQIRSAKERIQESIPAFRESILERIKICDGTMPELTEETLEEGESEIAGSDGSMLCPQAHANFMGLRKLIEKDWFESEGSFHSTNILSGYKFSY